MKALNKYYTTMKKKKKIELGTGESLRCCDVIPGAHFHAAIRISQYKHERRPNTQIFRILLQTNAQSLPFNDPKILRYVLESWC